MATASVNGDGDGARCCVGARGVATVVHHRGLDGVGEREGCEGLNDNYTEVTTTTGTGTRWARGSGGTRGTSVAVSDDNYGGGDDNYPRMAVTMGVVEREEGRG